MSNPFNIISHPNCHKGHQYALDILSGKINSNKYIKGACERYLKDLDREDLYHDKDWAEKFMVYFQRFEHVIGEWETPNIVLEPWQCWIYLNVEGFFWKKSGKRKYKTSYTEVARGNGKSAMASVVGLIYLNLIKSVKGNKVFSAATKKEQARIVLDSAREMAKANPKYCKKTGVQVYAHHIAHDKSGSEFKALSSDSKSLDGLQPVLGVVDELHAHKTREVYDVIDSAMSKRKDSLLLVITTAGFSLDGIGYSQSCYAKKVATGEIPDEAFFAAVYTLDEDDDWKDENNWIKSNPNMGVSVDIDTFKSKAFKASENPQDETNFKVKHLNVWQNGLTQFFSIKKWNNPSKILPREEIIEKMIGKRCYVGVDLASKWDLTAFSYIFKHENNFYFLSDPFCPEETIKESNNVNYSMWAEKGILNSTPGAAINYELIEDFLFKRSREFKFKDVHYDGWNASEFSQRMAKKRMEMVEYRMNTSNLSEPMKRIEAVIREGNFYHDGSPIVEWCLSNIVAKLDANDNVMPRKDHEEMKIDIGVSMIMAMGGWVKEEMNESVYESRGIRVL